MPPQPPYEYEHLYEQPYGAEPPRTNRFAPAGPRRAARSKTKLFVLLASTILAMLLAAGGVYYMSEGQGDGGATGSGPPEGGAPPEAGSGKEAGEGGGAGQKGFEGTWESGRKELTIGEKVRSGEDAGKNAVSYADPRGEGVCFGVGDERRSGAVFRIALKCEDGRGKQYIAGNSTRADDELTVKWDEGDRETLTWEGG